MIIKNGRILGVECKKVDAPRLPPSIRIAREDLQLERIAVVYPGNRRYNLNDNVEVVPIVAVAEGMAGLFP